MKTCETCAHWLPPDPYTGKRKRPPRHGTCFLFTDGGVPNEGADAFVYHSYHEDANFMCRGTFGCALHKEK